jgi:hypothetical protein
VREILDVYSAFGWPQASARIAVIEKTRTASFDKKFRRYARTASFGQLASVYGDEADVLADWKQLRCRQINNKLAAKCLRFEAWTSHLTSHERSRSNP